MTDRRRAGPQVVGEAALEARRRAVPDAGRPVSLDGEVDRPPPLRVAAPVLERGEHRLDRRVHVPLVHEHVLGREAPRAAQDRARERVLRARRQPGGVALILEVEREPGGGDELQPPASGDLPGPVERGQPLQPGLRPPGGPELHADAAVPVARVRVPVRRAGRRLVHVARASAHGAALGLEAHRALDHLVALALTWMDVGLRDEPARAPDHVELQHARSAAELDPHPEARERQQPSCRFHADYRAAALIRITRRSGTTLGFGPCSSAG